MPQLTLTTSLPSGERDAGSPGSDGASPISIYLIIAIFV
jgi:hypothetical protein